MPVPMLNQQVFTVEKHQVGENHEAPASCLVLAAPQTSSNDSRLNLDDDAATRTPLARRTRMMYEPQLKL